MGKVVNGEGKLTNDLQVVNRKRKKRRKELEQLRKNVLEAKRKLRDETAPPKLHVSTFNKILNNFADQRQKNDNKNQGFDNKGRRAGVKKMCNRLLPSRNPQVGIFANGSKGAEIKRGNLELNETDMARFEGDLQKVLCDGMKKKPKTRETSGSEAALIKFMNKPSVTSHTAVCKEEQKIDFEKLDHMKIKSEKCLECERQNTGKRKVEAFNESDEKSVKKVLLPVVTKKSEEKQAIVNVRCNNNFVKSEDKKTSNLVDQKGKRCLFQDVEEEEPEATSIRKPAAGFEELRFSPTIGRPKVKTNPIKRAMPFADTVSESEKKTAIQNNDRALFKHLKLGRMVATRYGELCAMVCTENFDNCLRNVPHVDPLKKVKKSLIDRYVASQRHNRLNFEKERAATMTSGSVERRPVRCSHLEKTTETFSDRSVPPTRKVTAAKAMRVEGIKSNKNVFQGNNIARNVCHPPYSSEETSVEVNHERSLTNFGGESPGYSKTQETERNFPTVADIPTDRRKIMIRYLKDLGNTAKSAENEVLKSPIFPPGVFVAPLSDSNVEIQKRYLGDPLRRHDMIGVKKGQNFTPVSLEKKSNSSDVSCDSGRTRLGLDLGSHTKIDRRAGRLRILNLETASPFTFAQIPSNRDKMSAQYIRGVKRANEVFSPDLLPKFVGDVGNNPKQHSIGDRQKKIFTMCRASKTEKHVPAILRKSQPTNIKNFTKETPGNNGKLMIRDVLHENFKWSPNQRSPNFEKKLTKAFFSKNQETFCNVTQNSGHSECSDITTKITRGEKSAVLQEPQLQTPTVINAIFDRTEKILKAKRNFMNAKSRQVTLNGEPNIEIRAPNFLRHKARQEIRPIRDSENPLNFMDAATIHRITNERQKVLAMSGAPDEECQRFPVYLKRKNESSTGGLQDKRYPEGRVQGQIPIAFQGNGSQTKVIIIHNPDLQKRPDPRDHNQQIYENNHFSGRGSEPASIIPLHLHQVQGIRPQQTAQQFQRHEVYPHHGNSECPQEAPRYSYPNTTTDVQLQPRIVYRQDAGRIFGSVNLQNNPGFSDRFQCGIPQQDHRETFDVSTSQKINSQFPHAASSASAVQMPTTFVSANYGSGNLNPQFAITNIIESKPIRLMDGRIGFILPKNNEHNSWCQNATQLQWNGLMIEDGTNCTCNYHIDPRRPQAEHQWNLQDYNVTDVYNHPGTTQQQSAPLRDHFSTKP